MANCVVGVGCGLGWGLVEKPEEETASPMLPFVFYFFLLFPRGVDGFQDRFWARESPVPPPHSSVSVLAGPEQWRTSWQFPANQLPLIKLQGAQTFVPLPI